MTHPIQAIAFDLDGTLVDSAPDVAHALNTALASVGLPSFDLVTVRSWIGDGPDATIERALQASARLGALASSSATDSSDRAPGALALQLRARFDAATLGAPLDHGHVYDGIAELLRSVAGRWPLAVVTNKPTALARAVLQAAGLVQHFQIICGADTPAQRKPATLLLQHATSALGVPLGALLMVGDGMPDLQAAHNAGCASAWVRWGYGTLPVSQPGAAPSITEPMPLWQLHTPHDLLRCLDGCDDAP